MLPRERMVVVCPACGHWDHLRPEVTFCDGDGAHRDTIMHVRGMTPAEYFEKTKARQQRALRALGHGDGEN